VTDPYRFRRDALIAAVTRSAGRLPPEVRAAIVDRARGLPLAEPIPQALLRLVDLVARSAPAIEVADLRGLADAGLNDEAVFEAIVASALGASLVRLERVDDLMGREG
jgi:hypothetical protein